MIQRWVEAFAHIHPGLGCQLCHDNPPFRDRICLSCLVRVLHWNVTIVLHWIERQDTSYIRQEAREEALRLWEKDKNPSGIIGYAEQYGVWLVDSRNLGMVKVRD